MSDNDTIQHLRRQVYEQGAEVERLRAHVKSLQSSVASAQRRSDEAYQARTDMLCERNQARAEVERLRQELEDERSTNRGGWGVAEKLGAKCQEMARVVEAVRRAYERATSHNVLSLNGLREAYHHWAEVAHALAALDSRQPDHPAPPEPAAEPEVQCAAAAYREPAAEPCPHASTTEYRDGVEDCDDCGEQLRAADGVETGEGGERRCRHAKACADDPSVMACCHQDLVPAAPLPECNGLETDCDGYEPGTDWTQRTKGGSNA